MKLSARHYGIIITTFATAILHLSAAFDKILFPAGPDPLFLLNGVGYLGLLGAYFLPIPFFQKNHKLVWWALVLFAIVTIIAWLVIWVGFYVIRDGTPFFSHDSIYGVPAKITEILLLFFLRADKE